MMRIPCRLHRCRITIWTARLCARTARAACGDRCERAHHCRHFARRASRRDSGIPDRHERRRLLGRRRRVAAGRDHRWPARAWAGLSLAGDRRSEALALRAMVAGHGDRDEPLRIPEPSDASHAHLAPDAMDVVLVPLLGFDRKGHRLGFGGGYYDRGVRVPARARAACEAAAGRYWICCAKSIASRRRRGTCHSITSLPTAS